MQQATACRGALDGFIAEVIEDHIREHMINPATAHDDPRTVAAEALVEIVHAYLTCPPSRRYAANSAGR
nr:metal-sensing transcriptional repressor [Sphingomonas sp. HMP9]